MKTKILIISILMLTLISNISFADIYFDAITEDFSKLEGTKVPSFIEPIFGDTSLNLHVTTKSGEEEIIGIRTENGVTQSVGPIVESPDIDVYITEDKIEEIILSSDPLNSFKSAVSTGEISYNANGWWNKIKFAIINFFLGLGSDESSEEQVLQEDASQEVEEEASDEVVDETSEQVIEEIESTEEVGKEENSEEEIIEEESDEVVEETIEQDTEETEEIEETQTDEDEVEAETVEEEDDGIHTVQLTEDGFDPDELTISVGDTVIWENVREGNLHQAMIVGTQTHSDIRSGVFTTGETYSWTFTEADDYFFVDGILTTQTSTITVE